MITSIICAITVISITVIICITVNICNRREYERYKYNEIKLIVDEIERIFNIGMNKKEKYSDILDKIMKEIQNAKKL